MATDQSPFRPFETQFDENAALKILREATAGADDGELFLERRRSEAMVFDDGRLKTASYDASEGFGLRAVKGETTGYAHSTEMTEAALKRAAETARLAVGSGGATMAPAPQATNQRLYTDADPMADAEFSVKVETLREIDAFTRDLDPRVVQVSASISATIARNRNPAPRRHPRARRAPHDPPQRLCHRRSRRPTRKRLRRGRWPLRPHRPH